MPTRSEPIEQRNCSDEESPTRLEAASSTSSCTGWVQPIGSRKAFGERNIGGSIPPVQSFERGRQAGSATRHGFLLWRLRKDRATVLISRRRPTTSARSMSSKPPERPRETNRLLALRAWVP